MNTEQLQTMIFKTMVFKKKIFKTMVFKPSCADREKAVHLTDSKSCSNESSASPNKVIEAAGLFLIHNGGCYRVI